MQDRTKLFCYGTLNVHEIQRSLWGERMSGKPFVLQSFELKMWPESTIFYIERKPGEQVVGKIYNLTEEQLKRTDVYESAAYRRETIYPTKGKPFDVYIINKEQESGQGN